MYDTVEFTTPEFAKKLQAIVANMAISHGISECDEGIGKQLQILALANCKVVRNVPIFNHSVEADEDNVAYINARTIAETAARSVANEHRSELTFADILEAIKDIMENLWPFSGA